MSHEEHMQEVLELSEFKDFIFVSGRMEELKRLGLVDGGEQLSNKGKAYYCELRLSEYKPSPKNVLDLLQNLTRNSYDDQVYQTLAGLILDTDRDIEAEVEKRKEEFGDGWGEEWKNPID